MSELLLPPGIRLPQPLQPKDEPDPDASGEQKAASLPVPTGWRILCVVPEVDTRFEGSSLVKADIYIKAEEHATAVLFVLKMGPTAYKDQARFGESGPWCKEGDFVLVRMYSGTRFKIFGKEFRLLNDDQIEAVVQDPRGITRV
jgi:co-chaperonin GroES (HSP10)